MSAQSYPNASIRKPDYVKPAGGHAGGAKQDYANRIATSRLGLWLFLISDSFVFGGLLVTRFYLLGFHLAAGDLPWHLPDEAGEALVRCLFQPSSGTALVGLVAALALVADNSQGLQIKDAGEQRSRGQMLAGLLEAKTTDWQSELEENFEVIAQTTRNTTI